MSPKTALVIHLYETYGHDIQDSANVHGLSLGDIYQLNDYIARLRLTTSRQKRIV